MSYLKGKLPAIVLLTALFCHDITAQISPGDLSDAHSSLEGISNCTKCHVLGNKVTNEKCLACHTEINSRITVQTGYHSSSDVKGKECSSCHSEHNGKNFRLIHMDLKTFDHKLTGYPLSAPHSRKACGDCHTAKYITDARLKTKKDTWLGVGTQCLNCHADYHMRTLSANCLNCHTDDTFVPAARFNHDNAGFKLIGKHRSVECIKCHRVTVTGGEKFQQFTGIKYTNCASCHRDPHDNQFGQNCRQCHSEESFRIITGEQKFDHNKTRYKLEGKHMIVNCKACHRGKFTDPLKSGSCTDCHADYHKGQFAKGGLSPDCSKCHSVSGFSLFSFTIGQHNAGIFPLEGSHLATPCYDCHKKKDNWSFRNIGLACNDCHQDIHQSYIESKYYPDKDCKKCHNESRWADIRFDHSVTGFKLTGAHAKEKCRSCHFIENQSGVSMQKFAGLTEKCSDCHADRHHGQFERGGGTDCTECHSANSWDPALFDHNKAAFRLDGRHATVPCAKCHKPQQEGSDNYIIYKIKDFRCESCHF